MRWDFGSSGGNFRGARRAAVSCIASRLRRGLQAGRLQPVVDMQGGLSLPHPLQEKFARRARRGLCCRLPEALGFRQPFFKGLFVLDAFPSPATIIGRRWLRVSCSRRTNHRKPRFHPSRRGALSRRRQKHVCRTPRPQHRHMPSALQCRLAALERFLSCNSPPFANIFYDSKKINLVLI